MYTDKGEQRVSRLLCAFSIGGVALWLSHTFLKVGLPMPLPHKLFVSATCLLLLLACDGGASTTDPDGGADGDANGLQADAGLTVDGGIATTSADGGLVFSVREFEDNNSWQPAGDLIERAISGFEPVDEGTFPVFVWVEGTGVHYWNYNGVVFSEEMAKRGFVAVSVAYDNVQYTIDCNQLDQKTKGVFDSRDDGSALHAVCEREKADCDKGIVVAGWSQGAHLAVRAKDFNPLVKAVLPFGNGISAYPGHDLTACLGIANTAIEGSKIRSLVGAADEFFGCNPDGTGCQRPGIREQQEETTGHQCEEDAFSCINDDGSGWYIVQNHETTWGADNHGFWLSFATGDFDPAFLAGDAWWSLNSSLDWLAQHADGPSLR